MKPYEVIPKLKPIIMILLPIILIKIGSRFSYRVWRLRLFLYVSWFVILLPVWMTLAGIATTAVYALSEATNTTATVKASMYLPNESADRLVQLPYTKQPTNTANHPNPQPFKGADYATFCGDELVAPQSGYVESIGTDRFCGNYGCNNTFITFTNQFGVRSTMLHGDYILNVGDPVVRGETIVGYEASNGNSSGCHTDFWTNGRMVDIKKMMQVPSTYEKPLKLSWYDPSLCYKDGEVRTNINCDSDPGHFASMVPVTPDRYGRTAACVPEWMGATVVIKGYGEFKCLDTGGAIKEHYDFIWVDLLLHDGNIPNGRHVLFGTFVYEWELVWR